MNTLNKESITLIKSFEGLETKAYKDIVGVWTIGYGHTSAAGNPKVQAGMVITEAEAESILKNDIEKVYGKAVRNLVKVDINDNQYGALVSFCYNLGEGNFKSSTLLKKVNAKDFSGASKEFAKWNKAGGKIVKGLTRRRAAEAALFLKPVFLDPQKPVQTLPDVPKVVEPEKPNPTQGSSMTLLAMLMEMLSKMFGGKND